MESRRMLAVIDLAALTAAQGSTIFGADPDDHVGASVSIVGDVNGDGFDDLLIGAADADAASNGKPLAGETYLIFGRASLPATIDLANLGSAGVTIFGVDAGDMSGVSVGSAGDMNGDGFDDLLIGAQNAYSSSNSKPYAGESYVVFGGAALPRTIDLASLGSAGITIFGADRLDLSGRSVGPAGDVNGDGFDDLLIGANGASASGNSKAFAGESYVIFGGAALPKTIDLASLDSAGVTIFGADANDQSGWSVGSAGDMNGDGFDDLLIGARYAFASGNSKANAGETYVIFGSAALPATIDLANLGSAGVTIFGADAEDYSSVVSGAGDVNGDGFDDLLIGAPRADASGNSKSNAGDSYVIFGSAALPATIDLASLGAAGITLFGADAEDYSSVVSGAGDVNGDGFDDLLVGAPFADAFGNKKPTAGGSYLIFGGAALPGTIDLATLRAGGVTIFGADAGDECGGSVSGAGDVNGDGFDDLLIGAAEADSQGNARADAGESYLIFGGQLSAVIFNIDDVTVNEAAGTLTFTVSLSTPLDAVAKVNVSYGNGTAADNGRDYDSTVDQVTFAANSIVPQTVTVAIQNDNLVEASESFVASLALDLSTPLIGYTTDLTDTAIGTITDDDTATFSINDATVNEAAGTLTLAVSLSNPIDTAVRVNVGYGGGTATGGGIDYDSTTDQVTFAANSTVPQTVTVAIRNDDLVEASETFVASLALDVSSPLTGYTTQLTDTGVGTITDDDTATFSISDVTVDEAAGTLTFTVSLSHAIDVATIVVVSYGGGTATGGGIDYDSAIDQVTFGANTTTPRTVTVAINNDNLVETSETFVASLALSGATPLTGYAKNLTDTGTATITDNDTATFRVSDVTVDEAAGTLTLSVSLSNPIVTAATVNVSYGGGTATGGGADYDSSVDQVTFAANSNVAQTVTVAIANDNLVEAAETFVASLALDASSPLVGFAKDLTDTGTGTIADNDTATFRIDDVTVDETAATLTFSVSLSQPIDRDTMLNISYGGGTATGGGADYDSSVDQVTFAANSNVARTVTVAINNDDLVEAAETFVASLALDASTQLIGYAKDLTDTGIGTVMDNDRAIFSIGDVVANEAAGTLSFAVSVSHPLDTAATVIVAYSGGTATGGGTDYDSTSDRITFGAFTTTARTVTVALHNDNLVEAAETFQASLALDASTPLIGYAKDLTDTGTGTITDNDTAMFTIDDVTVNEAAQTLTFAVSLSNPLDTDTVVHIRYGGGTATGGDADYDSASDSVAFAARSTAVQTVTVAINNDGLVEAAETFVASLALDPSTPLTTYPSDLTDTATGTITDDDTALFTIDDVTVSEASGTLNFTVSLSNPIDTVAKVNVTLGGGTATGGGTDYDSGGSQLTFAANSTAGQTVSLAIHDDSLVEATETLIASLALDASTPLTNHSKDLADAATGTIMDDDKATFRIHDTTVDEAAGTLTFSVSLSNPIDTTAKVNVRYSGGTAIGGGTDYDSASDQLVFGPNSTTARTATVALHADDLVEATETFVASLTLDESTSLAGYATDLTATATGTIIDDDEARFSVDDLTVNETTGTLGFTVSLSSPIDRPVTVNVVYGSGTATGGGVDYDSTSDRVTFAANSTTAQAVTVAIQDDLVVEATETLVASLALDVTTPLTGYNKDLTDTGIGTITDNDTAVFSINDVRVDESAGLLKFTVSLSNPLDRPTTVQVIYGGGTATGDGVDYDSARDQLTFAANVAVPQTVAVAILNDELSEATETFIASLVLDDANPLTGYAKDLTDTGTATITDDDSPGDFDGDGDIDVDDIDLLCNAINGGGTDLLFDLNGSGAISLADLDELIRNILQTSYGDADLNGLFDSVDFIQVFQAGQYEDSVEDNSNWATGDWNCDREFDSSDLVKAFQMGTYEEPAPAQIGGRLTLALSADTRRQTKAELKSKTAPPRVPCGRPAVLDPFAADRIFTDDRVATDRPQTAEGELTQLARLDRRLEPARLTVELS